LERLILGEGCSDYRPIDILLEWFEYIPVPPNFNCIYAGPATTVVVGPEVFG
jgi:hypothetical protein